MKPWTLACLVAMVTVVVGEGGATRTSPPTAPEVNWPFAAINILSLPGQGPQFNGLGSFVRDNLVLVDSMSETKFMPASFIKVAKDETGLDLKGDSHPFNAVSNFTSYPVTNVGSIDAVPNDDVTVLLLEKPMVGVTTVELNDDPDCPEVNDVCKYLHVGDEKMWSSYHMYEVNATVIDPDSCDNFMAGVTSSTICVIRHGYSNLANSVDRMAGGPLMCTCGGRWVQAGVHSPPTFNSQSHSNVHAFTKVSFFKTWIQQQFA